MRVLALVWPPMSRRYTLTVGCGRLLHAAFLILGSMGVVVELTYWHGQWSHLVSYMLMWVGAAIAGRTLRAILSRE